MPSDADLVYERALKVLPVVKARLPDDYFYASLPLCVIDAVWSLGVNYKSVLNVVGRYCEKVGIPRYRSPDEIPDVQETVSDLVTRLNALNAELGSLASSDRLFANRKPTSRQSGILKSEAVRRFAAVLRDHGLERLEDAQRAIANPAANGDL